MSKAFAVYCLSLIIGLNCYGQISNLNQLITPSQWDSLFPKRAGTYGAHPQGFTEDFYSYNNLSMAVSEMADYIVTIKRKQGLFDQLITIERKSDGSSYIYSDVEAWWNDHPAFETTTMVDFEDFLNTSSVQNNKRELAAFLANISKETTGGWQFPVGVGTYGDYADWGLYFVHEVGYNSSNGAGAYSQAHDEFPPNPAVGYYGRGPIQLSWNYNYGQFSKFLFNDPNVLLNNPDLLQQNGVLSFQSAIWFWMMPQCPKPSCHQVMHNLWVPDPDEYSEEKMFKKGFAHTNNIINGGLECRASSTAAFTEKVILRSELYKYYMQIAGFTPEEVAMEDVDEFTTLCYETAANTMTDYLSCNTLSNNDTTTVHINFISEEDFIVYPNPATSLITIENSLKNGFVEIFDLSGNLLALSRLQSNQHTIDVSNLHSGVYFIKATTDEKVLLTKFIKTDR